MFIPNKWQNRLRLCSLICVIVFSTGTIAELDVNECKEEINELANEFDSDFNKFVVQHEQKIAELRAKYLALEAGKADDFEYFLSKFEDTFDIKSEVLPEQEIYFNTLKAIPDDTDMQHNCEKLENVETRINKKLEWAERRLEGFQEDLETLIGLEDLDDDEGLVFISAYTNTYGELRIKGKDDFKINISRSAYTKVHKVAAGTYQFFKLQRRQWNRDLHYYNFEDDNLTFEVEAGKLNLSGVFMFEEINKQGRGELFDRASLSLGVLESDYPHLLRKYQWNNGVTDFDTFIQFYREEIFEDGVQNVE